MSTFLTPGIPSLEKKMLKKTASNHQIYSSWRIPKESIDIFLCCRYFQVPRSFCQIHLLRWVKKKLPGSHLWNILKMADFLDRKSTWFCSLLGDANGVPLLISYLILQQSNERDKQWLWKEDQDRSKSKYFEISPAPSPEKRTHQELFERQGAYVA